MEGQNSQGQQQQKGKQFTGSPMREHYKSSYGRELGVTRNPWVDSADGARMQVSLEQQRAALV